MQPIKILSRFLSMNANEAHFLFRSTDLRILCPHLSEKSFRTLLSRAVSSGLLTRVCRGIYLYPEAVPNDGLLLFHVAALLRAADFNYISLETVLSDSGIISQVLMNHITLMSSGRTNTINCHDFGKIEFIHTNQKPENLVSLLSYDKRCGLWRANVTLALRDMKRTHRDDDLIDWELANEFI